jgi:hypothetical protein
MGRLSLRTCVWLAATLVLGLRLTLLDAQTCPGCYARQYVPDLPMTGNGTCPGSSGGTEYNYIVDYSTFPGGTLVDFVEAAAEQASRAWNNTSGPCNCLFEGTISSWDIDIVADTRLKQKVCARRMWPTEGPSHRIISISTGTRCLAT